MTGDKEGLAWQKPGVVGAKMAERMIWGCVVDQVPSIFGPNAILHKGSQESKNESEQKAVLSRSSSTFIPAALAITTTLAAAIAGYLSYTSYTTKNLERGKKLSDMGEAGALFSALDFGPAMSDGEARARVVPVGVEVDVSGDGEV